MKEKDFPTKNCRSAKKITQLRQVLKSNGPTAARRPTGGPGARRVKLYIVYARIYSILLKIM